MLGPDKPNPASRGSLLSKAPRALSVMPGRGLSPAALRGQGSKAVPKESGPASEEGALGSEQGGWLRHPAHSPNTGPAQATGPQLSAVSKQGIRADG